MTSEPQAVSTVVPSPLTRSGRASTTGPAAQPSAFTHAPTDSATDLNDTPATLRRPLHVRGWRLRLPPLGVALLQTLIAVLDWSLAGLALYVLLPPGLPVGFFQFLGIFALANLGGLLSHVPGGVGVFEAVILLAVPDGADSASVAAVLIAYRLIYFLLPLLLAALLLGAHQAMTARVAVGRVGRQIGDWALIMSPNLFALLVFTAGAMLLASGASPASTTRGASCRSGIPSTSSIRTTVARVKGRLPDSAFSSVERLILAMSARAWRETRRLASSSRRRAAIASLSTARNSVWSAIVPAFPGQFRTHPHIASRPMWRSRKITPRRAEIGDHCPWLSGMDGL